jgi:hypothetical protein
MNYDIYTDTNDPILLLEDALIEDEFRPQVGQEIFIKRTSKNYRITRSDPTNNPATEKVTYYVVPADPEENPFRMDHDRLEEHGLFR